MRKNIRISIKSTLTSLSFLLTTLLIISCPNPLDEMMLLQVMDQTDSSITILSPSSGSYCAKMVEVTGIVTDTSTPSGDTGAVKSLRYEILSTSLSGDVEVAHDGSFTFNFATNNLASPFELKITAEDWNGNFSSVSLSLLLKAGDDIPSFSVAPGNQLVTLSWDDVPSVEKYTLYYTTENSLPSETYGIALNDVSSPKVITGLENGAMHVFLLHGHSSAGEDNVSDYAYSIPLSTQTLTPEVITEQGQLKIFWPSIDATDQFEVWRGTERDGLFTFISGTRTGNEYIDKRLESSDGYFYSVKPALQGSLMSGSAFGAPYPFEADPTLGSILTDSNAYNVAVSGNYALVAARYAGLQVVDVTTPEYPVIVKTIDTSAAYDICIVGNLAYVADQPDGIWIFDITNPALPFVVDTIEISTSEYPYAIDVAGDYAFVACVDNGLKIVDINPENIATYGTVRRSLPMNSTFAVDVEGNYAFVSGSTNLQIISFNPADITAASVVKIVTTPEIIRGVAADGDYVYVAVGNTGLQIISIDDIPTAAVVATIATAGFASDVETAGNRAYVTHGIEGLIVFDKTLPEQIRPVMYIDTIDNASGVTVSSEIAYIADGSTGLRIIDTKNPSSAEHVKTITGSGLIRGAAISNNYAYASDGMGFLRVIDISTPPYASIIHSLPTQGAPQGVVISGNYAYMANQYAGLQIIDIHDHDNMSIIGTVDTPGSALRVAIVGDYAFVADDTKSIQVIDISTPATAHIIKTIADTTGTKDVFYDDGKIFAAANSGKFHIIDASDPESASILKTIEDPEFDFDYPFAVAVSGDYAYIADRVNGVQVIDISNVQAASVILTIPTSGDARELDISGAYLFAALGSGGVDIIDISDPETAFVVKEIASTNFTYDVTIAGKYIYIADGNGGMQIINMIP